MQEFGDEKAWFWQECDAEVFLQAMSFELYGRWSQRDLFSWV